MTILKITACLLAAALLQGCSSRYEVSRVKSPSGRIDAVVMERNGGATTSFRNDVYLVLHGGKPSDENRIAVLIGPTRSESAYGVNVVWRDETFLAIEFLTAKSVEIERSMLEIGGKRIVVALQEGVRGPSAPSTRTF